MTWSKIGDGQRSARAKKWPGHHAGGRAISKVRVDLGRVARPVGAGVGAAPPGIATVACTTGRGCDVDHTQPLRRDFSRQGCIRPPGGADWRRAGVVYGNSPRVFLALRTLATPIAMAAVRFGTLSFSAR